MYVSSNKKDWDTYLQSEVYAHNTTLSDATGDTPFFLSYGRKQIKIADVSLLPTSCLSRSVDYHRQRMINQIKIARTHAVVHTYTAQQRIKVY